MRTAFSDGFMYDRASPYYQERRERQANLPMELNLVPANIIDRLPHYRHRHHNSHKRLSEYAPYILGCVLLLLALITYSSS